LLSFDDAKLNVEVRNFTPGHKTLRTQVETSTQVKTSIQIQNFHFWSKTSTQVYKIVVKMDHFLLVKKSTTKSNFGTQVN
jgi:hypothetical protein